MSGPVAHESYPSIRVNLDPVLSRRIRVAERRLDNQGDVSAFTDFQNRSQAIVESDEPGDRMEAVRVSAAATDYLNNDFNTETPLDALSSLYEALRRANEVAGQIGKRFRGVFVRIFRDNESTWRVATAAVGGDHAYLYSADPSLPRSSALTADHIPGSALDGTEEAMNRVQFDVQQIDNRDRVALVSQAVAEDRGKYERIHVRAAQSSTIEELAEVLRGDKKAARDRVVIAAEILSASQSRNAYGKVVPPPPSVPAIGAGTAPSAPGAAASAAATARPVPGTMIPGTPHRTVYAHNQRIGILGTGPMTKLKAHIGEIREKRDARIKRGEKTKLAGGASLIGGAALAMATGAKKWMTAWNNPERRAEFVRSRPLRSAQNGVYGAWHRLGAWTTVGLSSFAPGRKTYRQHHSDDPMYRNTAVWNRDEMIQDDLDRRHARRNALVLGGIALGAVAGWALAYYLSKGNVHHPGAQPGTGVGQGPIVISPPGRHVPPYHPSLPPSGGGVPGGANTPPSLPQNPSGAPGSNYQYDVMVANRPFEVEHGSGIIKEISELYTQVTGHKPPNGLADQIYFNRPSSIGNNMINLPTYHGPMPGDIRIGTESSSAHWTPAFADYVAREISEHAAA